MVGNICRTGFLFSCLIFFGLGANFAPTTVFGQEETSETAPATNGADAATAITNDSESEVEVGGAAIPQDPPSNSEASSVETSSDTVGTYPLVVLAIGIVAVLVLIIGFKINAFIALISAAMLVSVLAPGNIETKISRVATSFGNTAGGIAIVIALAAVIGKCMLDSGAADRIVRAFLNLFGE